MPSPVFTGDPPRPLFIPGGSGVVPALADDPCACCGELFDCPCCGDFSNNAAGSVLLSITGAVEGPGIGQCNQGQDIDALNSTFVLDLTPSSPCAYRVDLSPRISLCRGTGFFGGFNTCLCGFSVTVCPSIFGPSIQATVRLSQATAAGVPECGSGSCFNLRTFTFSGPPPYNCLNGSYQLTQVGGTPGDSIVNLENAVVTVTFIA